MTRKRQWGSEKNTTPLPIVHFRPSNRKITSSRIAIVLTVLFWFIYLVDTVIRQFFDGPHTFQFTVQAVSYVTVVTFLTFSALMYLLARQGAYQRFRKHVRVPRAELENHFADNQPPLTVLIPSYSEEIPVIRKTLISAWLQEYPAKRIVLLVDDNPNPTTDSARRKLARTRNIGREITQQFAEPRERFHRSQRVMGKNKAADQHPQELLVAEYRWAATWLKTFADQEVIEDHVDIFFVDQVVRALADEFSLTAKALATSLRDRQYVSPDRLNQLAQRLRWIFSGEIEVFERKTYTSLSHEANKAMNLNSYIGLMGGAYSIRQTPDGRALMPVSIDAQANLVVPDSNFLLTLDADSILLRDYCLRLVHLMQQPDHRRVAVVQTPYSSFRGAPTRIERLAGATTDIQHILHQGMTQYGATFWVGANAIIRKEALHDIVEKEWVGGFEIKRYIQDRTVIEDTESSIDLAGHGWKLLNYPERLSYSATPPDFGALVVQRQRWANGGLLIVPKLFARLQVAKHKSESVSAAETMLRVNYMASIAWSSFGLLFMLAYPFDGRLLSPLVVLAALPYFFAMASDLKYCGYNRSDVLRIYGFNLILLPVNLGGVLKSIQQALSSQKIPFARTPKVKNRTVAPMLYVVAPLLIVAFSVLTFARSYQAANWVNAGFAVLNALLATWAIVAYIGIGNMLVDIWVGVRNWLFVETIRSAKQSENSPPSFDWRAVLYHGDPQGKISVPQAAEVADNGGGQDG